LGTLHLAFYRDWNPAVDKHLPVKYDVSSFKQGKAACKVALQEELGLPVNKDIPLIAFIGRLDYQKGADIVLQVGVWGCRRLQGRLSHAAAIIVRFDG
jgi:glycogen synthase